MEVRAHDIAKLGSSIQSVIAVTEYPGMGHLVVQHDGSITWDELQALKNELWGAQARAIELYPMAQNVVNSGNFRHLWRLGFNDWAPDLLGDDGGEDTLRRRYTQHWAEAHAVFAKDG